MFKNRSFFGTSRNTYDFPGIRVKEQRPESPVTVSIAAWPHYEYQDKRILSRRPVVSVSYVLARAACVTKSGIT